MHDIIRRPEEILAYRPLRQILGAKPNALWTVGPADSALVAMQTMADKHIGFLVVQDRGLMVGVLSERDCVRHIARNKTPLEATPVGELMTRGVIAVDLSQTFADCLRLMHQNRIRHLPVVEDGKPVAVVSIRDLLGEAVAHHAKIINQLELERLTFFTSAV